MYLVLKREREIERDRTGLGGKAESIVPALFPLSPLNSRTVPYRLSTLTPHSTVVISRFSVHLFVREEGVIVIVKELDNFLMEKPKEKNK